MKNKNQILSSAPTKDELKKQVACYFVCSPDEITLEYPNGIVKNGKVMKGWIWRKQGLRYRFENKK